MINKIMHFRRRRMIFKAIHLLQVFSNVILGPPFLKRFALCSRAVVCLSRLSVCDIDVFWPYGWMDQDATWLVDMKVGLSPGHAHCVRWGPSSPSPTERGTSSPAPHFSAHFAVAQSPISATGELLLSYSSVAVKNISTNTAPRGFVR